MAVDESMTRTAVRARQAAVDVVLVDDRRMVVEGLIAAWARETRLRVVGVAHRACDAVPLVDRAYPEVVIVHDRLIDADGVAVAADLVVAHPELKVVLLTGAITPDVVSRARRAGAVGVVSATSSVDELGEAVRRVRRGETAFPAPRLDQPAAHGLSERELEVLWLVASGRPAEEIAAELVVSRHTVRNHVRNILLKLGAHSKLEAVATAVRLGIIRLD